MSTYDEKCRDNFTRIHDKLDNIITNQHNIDQRLTKQVTRNSTILSGLIWTIGVLIGTGLTIFVAYIT